MANLTIEEKVVYEAAELNPIEGHALAIFEVVGEGHEFREIIAPGNRFRKKFGKKYFAVAVNTAPNLKLEFSARVGARGKVHSFDLDLSLNYSIIDPKSIAVQMKNDPLRQLREEIKRIIGRTFWRTLQRQIEDDSKHNTVPTLTAQASTDVSDTTDLQYVGHSVGIVGLNQRGTSYEALYALHERLEELWVFYKHRFQTFHPKMYLFSPNPDSEGQKAVTVIGSSNLTSGGLDTNFEVSWLQELDPNVTGPSHAG